MNFEPLSVDRHPVKKVSAILVPLVLAFVAIAGAIFIGRQAVNPVLLFISAISILFAVVAFANPFSGLLCLVAFVPFIDFFKRFMLAFGDPSDVEWYLLIGSPDLILLCIYFAVLLGLLGKRQRFVFRLHTVDVALLLFLLWVLTRTIFVDIPMAVTFAEFKLRALYIPLYFVGALAINTKEDLAKLLRVFLLCAIIAGLYGIYQALFGLSSFEQVWSDSGRSMLDPRVYTYGLGSIRPFSTHASTDSFGYSLVIALVLVPLIETRRWLKGLKYSVLMAAFVLDLARTCWVYYLSILIFYKVLRSSLPSIKKWAAVGLLVVGLLGLNFMDPLFQYVAERAESPAGAFIARALDPRTFSERIAGRQYILLNPDVISLTGVGLGASASSARKFLEDVIIAVYAHDLLTEIIHDLGIIGLLLFLLFWVLHYRYSLNAVNSVNDLWLRKIGYLSLSIVILLLFVGSLSGGSFLSLRPVNTIFWLLAGVLTRLKNLDLQEENVSSCEG